MSIPIEGYEETCKNCRFFLEKGLDGVCKRYPPVLASFRPSTESFYGPAEQSLWRFPLVGNDDWCGEHQVNDKLTDSRQR